MLLNYFYQQLYFSASALVNATVVTNDITLFNTSLFTSYNQSTCNMLIDFQNIFWPLSMSEDNLKYV